MTHRTSSRREFLIPSRGRKTKPAPVHSPSQHLLRAGRPAMACQFEIVFAAYDRTRMSAVHRTLDLIQALDRQMTVYREDSEIMQVNRRAHLEPVKVEPRLFSLLELSFLLHRESGGAFDITAGPLSRCWGFTARQGRVPETGALVEALSRVGTAGMILDRTTRIVKLSRPGMELNLGSIGKGYALDRAAEHLRSEGFSRALLHAGYSTILALGESPFSEGWKVSLRHPVKRDRSLAVLSLSAQALSTSGIGEQSFRSAGKLLGHILDPRTGQPARHHLMATAVAPTAALADALSTAFFIMTTREVEQFCSARPEVGALIVTREGEEGPLQLHTFGIPERILEVSR